jgi:hypothetical protein
MPVLQRADFQLLKSELAINSTCFANTSENPRVTDGESPSIDARYWTGEVQIRTSFLHQR